MSSVISSSVASISLGGAGGEVGSRETALDACMKNAKEKNPG